MTVRILCVGKLKEAFYRDAVLEYTKRLGRYARIEICEVQDEKTPENATPSEERRIKEREGERLIRLIRDGDYCIALAIDGKAYSSERFSSHLSSLMGSGRSTISFLIGGSLGLSDAVLGRADEKLSFSAFTFPHQLMRVILLEQIYRAFRIMRNEPYHK